MPKLKLPHLLAKGIGCLVPPGESPPSRWHDILVNQPSRFLPLADEAKMLVQKLKEEQEASQWSGIPIEQIPNNSFCKQLNYLQSLQQIASLHSARQHLLLDIITILERLGKVDNTSFDKLYYLAENCAD